MPRQINPTIPDNSVRYFTNARGVNYLPPLRSEWEKSGHLPRLPLNAFAGVFGATSYDASSYFGGTNKTSQWWYYNSEDNDYYLGLLRSVGMNCIRVFLDYYVWEADPETHLANIDDFLSLCDKHKIRCQFVPWDGIHLGTHPSESGFFDIIGTQVREPSSINHPDSVPHGLVTSWHRVPHAFEYSSIPQAQDFFTNRATPYLDALFTTVSSHQSMWSFDVQNEFDDETAWVFTSATAEYITQQLSSVGITTTVGNGAGYDPGLADLYNDTSGASGSLSLFYTEFSSVLDFASLHSYANTRFSLVKYVKEGIQGAADTGMPSMYNESTNYSQNAIPSAELDYLYSSMDFGGMMFDGFIENSLSREPFLDSQGLFFADGTVKRTRDVSAYVFYADSENWFAPGQLARNFTQKAYSVDEGLDSGFFSGAPLALTTYLSGTEVTYTVAPNHREYSTSYSGVSEDDWRINRDAVYAFINGASPPNEPLVGGKHSGASLTYPDLPGSPAALDVKLNFAHLDYTSEDIVNLLYDLSSLPTLASFTEDVDSAGRNLQLLHMTEVFRLLMWSSFDGNLNEATRSILTGTEWDYNLACTPAARSALSGAWEPLGALNTATNTVLPTVNNTYLTNDTWDVTDLACHAGQDCYYVGGSYISNPTDAQIDWASYDTLYTNLRNAMVECVNQHAAYSIIDPDFGLF